MGLGANVVEDAIYPTAPGLHGRKALRLLREIPTAPFPKDQLPPASAFWSLTMYNDQQFFADNPLDRYAIGDRDIIKLAPPDGSVTIYIQRDSPGKEKESNWLPAPAEGTFTMNLRLYWPKPEVRLMVRGPRRGSSGCNELKGDSSETECDEWPHRYW